MNTAPSFLSLPTEPPRGIAPAEWDCRVRLAACYRIFDLLGWTEMIYNHITLRVPPKHPGEAPSFLINPFGLNYEEVTASNLVKIDLQGKKLDDSPYDVNPAGFVIHGALHEHLPEAHCVMHTHTTEGMAVASQAAGLAMCSFHSVVLHKRVAYHDFEGITTNLGERERMLKSIGQHRTVILRNHGLLTWAPTLPEAFTWMWHLQRACEVQVATQAMGPTQLIDEAVCEKSYELLMNFDTSKPFGEDMFAAMQRKVDKRDPSYRG